MRGKEIGRGAPRDGRNEGCGLLRARSDLCRKKKKERSLEGERDRRT